MFTKGGYLMTAVQVAMPEMFGLGEYVAAKGMYLEADEDHRRWELIGDPVVLYDPPPLEVCEEHDHLLVGWEEAFCPFC
jgi:hypothetical protein